MSKNLFPPRDPLMIANRVSEKMYWRAGSWIREEVRTTNIYKNVSLQFLVR